MALGRKAKWTLVVAGSLVLLFGLSHTPPAKELVRRVLVSAASSLMGGRVSVGELDYQLWRGAAELSDVVLEPDIMVVPFNFTADRLEVRFSPSLKISATLERPELVFIDFFDTPATDYTPVLPHIGTLGVVGGAIRFQDHDEAGELEEWIAIEGVAIDLFPTDDEHRVAFHARAGHAYDATFGAVDADLFLRPGHLRAASASVFKDDSFLRVSGELDFSGDLQAQIDSNFALDGALARLIDEELDIVGIVAGSTRIDVVDGTSTIESELTSDSLAWEGFLAEELEAEIVYEAGTLTLRRLEARGYGGRARLGAEVSFAEASRNRFELSWSGIDAVGVVAALADESLPLAARIGGEASLTLTGFSLDSATGNARVELEAGSDIVGTVVAALDSEVVSVRAQNMSVPELGASLGVDGTVTTRGEIDLDVEAAVQNVATVYEQSPVPIEGGLSVRGKVRGAFDDPRLSASLASDGLRIHNDDYELTGGVLGSAGELTLDDVRLDGKLGSISARGSVPLADAGMWSVDASLEGIVAGTVNVFGPAEDPDWSTELVVTPTEGRYSLVAHKSGRTLHVDELTGAVVEATLIARGSYDLDSESVDAHLALRDFRPSELAETAKYLYGFDGVVEVDATVAGSFRSPTGEAAVRIDDLTYDDAGLPSINVSFVGKDGTVGFEAARDDGTRVLTGELELSDAYPLHAEIDLAGLPISEILHTFQIFLDRERAVWTAAGTAILDVPLSEPSALVFRAEVDSVEARFTDATAQTSRFTIDGNTERFRIEGFELRGVGNELEIEGEVPLSAEASFDLKAEGRLDLGFLELLEPDLHVEGLAVVAGTVHGSLEAPDIDGTLKIVNGSGAWAGITWSDLSLSATADEDRLSDLALDARVLGGRVELNGQVPFLAEADPGRLEFRVMDFDIMPDDSNGSVVVGLSGAIDLPSPDIASWSGAGVLERISGQAAQALVELARPAPWRLDAGSLAIPDIRLESESGTLDINIVSIGIGQLMDDVSDVSIDATANGIIDLAFANAFIDSSPHGGTHIDGRLELASAMQRVDGELALQGRATLTKGRLSMVNPGFILSDVNAVLVLDDETVTVSELSVRAGSGTLSGRGSIDLSAPSRPVLDLEATANAVPLEIMDGLRAEVSGDLRLDSTAGEPRLSGNLTLDRGLLTRELQDDDNSFSAQTVVLSDPTEAAGPLDRLALDVIIATARNVRVENSAMQLEAAGSISIGGTIAAPELGGVVNLQADGTFNIARNKFQVTQGRIDLTGFPLVSPNIQLLAITKVGSTTIHVNLDGDMDDMRTRLTAPESPDLTEGDLASLLVTGRTLENAGEGGQQMASTWMMSSLANLVHDGLGDLFSFGPAPGAGPLILAEESDPTSRLTLGVPVTERLSVTYSIALDSTERRLWILDYRVARNVWLRATQENSNDYGFGLSQRFSLDLRRKAATERAVAREQRIARVEIDGARANVIERLKIRAGDRYNYWTVWDAAVTLEKSLVKEGFRSAVVDVNADVDESGTRDEVGLRFVVDTGKSTDFVWRGDAPPKNARKRLERDWNGRIPEEFLLADVTRRAAAELRAERYYSAIVEASIEELEKSRNVVFDIVRGPRSEKTQLTFSGNSALPDKLLGEALPKTNAPELFLLLNQPSELERGIRLRYAAEGYLDVAVGTVQTSYQPETKTFMIEIPVDEGSPTEILSVSFDGELTFDSETLSNELGIEPGTPVDFPEIRRGQTRLRTLYRNEGFPDVKVRAFLERTGEGLEVRVLVDEGARARVGEVRIVGNRRTHPNVIRNQLTFAANQPIRVIDFQETQRRLYDLGVFRSADVRTDPTQHGQQVQDVLIQVVERADLDVSYGLRYNVVGSEQYVSTETEPKSSGLEVVSRVNLVNQFGRGTNIGVSVFFQSKFQLFRVTYRRPSFFGRRIVTELFADTERDEERFGIENFETRNDAVTFQQTKKLTDNRREKFALQWNVRFGRFRANVIDENGIRDVDTNRPRFGVSLIEDRRDSFANPTKGRFWNITLQAVPEILGSDVAYVRLYGQFFYTYPITKSLVWASGIRMGFAKGNKELLLMEDRFQAGGANSVRGFKQNTLGPSVVIEESQERLFVGGQAVGVFNQELRFPIYKALHLGVYWDAGNVFTIANQFRLSDLRHSVGAGLRFVLPFGAIRFDWAEALNAQPEDETTRFHFSFGYAF